MQLYSCFVEASPTEEKAASCWKTDRLAKLPQCSSLAVREFCPASEERYEQGYGRVCAKLSVQMWRLKHIRTIAG